MGGGHTSINCALSMHLREKSENNARAGGRARVRLEKAPSAHLRYVDFSSSGNLNGTHILGETKTLAGTTWA